MADCTKVIGRMESKMAMEFMLARTMCKDKDIGKMGKELNGWMKIDNINYFSNVFLKRFFTYSLHFNINIK